MKIKSLKKSFALASVVCSFSPLAHTQTLAIDSLDKLSLLPGLQEANPVQEVHALTSPKGKMVYSKVELVFGGPIGSVLESYHFNSLTATLGSRFFAPRSATGSKMPIPSVFNGTNQEFTLLSVVPDTLSILALKQGFSGRALSDALVNWSKGSALLMIEGGDAWRIMGQLPAPRVLEREQVGEQVHETVISSQGYVVCAMESFVKTGAETKQTSCLVAMDIATIARNSFSLPQMGCGNIQQVQQQQQRQQMQQQPQQRRQTQIQQMQQQQMQQQRQQLQIQQQQQRQQFQAQPAPSCGF